MKKILIIESDPVLRAIYRSKFDLSGFTVEAVDDAPAALVAIPKFQPGLIQMDLSLRSMGGPDLIRQIRAMPGFKRTPIVVLSSFYRADLIKEAFDAGADKCISKTDCTASQALEIVDRIFNTEIANLDSPPPPEPAIPAVLPPAPTVVPPPAALPTSSLFSSTPGTAARLINPSPPSRIGSTHLAPAPSQKAPLTALPGHSISSPVSTPLLPGNRPSAAPRISTPASPAPAAAPATPESPTENPFGGLPGIEAAGRAAPALSAEATTFFRRSIRQDFLKRVPQIQAELRERVGALVRSKNPSEQLTLLRGFDPAISSLVGLAGITGFSRIAHLAGAMEALLRDLQEKPHQMTSSVLRTIAHASDCLNVLFRDINQDTQEIPQSLWILAVDDDPISRRTISVALAKANLRCLSIADSKMALTILGENQFDLIFLDADMPVMNGFELCAELRKMPPHKSTPVIFVTGLTNFEVRAQSSLAGANDLIAKPFLMMELAVKSLTYLLRPKASGDTKIQAVAK